MDNTNLLPSHYPLAGTCLDPIGACLTWKVGFCEGNIIKYVIRWKKKGGVEDLKKARVYLDRLIYDAEMRGEKGERCDNE